MIHTRPGGIYHILWGGLTLGFWIATVEVLIFGYARSLDLADLNTPGAVWSLLLSAFVWLLGIPLTLGSFLFKRAFTLRQVAALAIVMSGALVLLSVALGWDRSLATRGAFLPNLAASAVEYFIWMLGGTLAGSVFWLAAFTVGNATVAGWKKLAGD